MLYKDLCFANYSWLPEKNVEKTEHGYILCEIHSLRQELFEVREEHVRK